MDSGMLLLYLQSKTANRTFHLIKGTNVSAASDITCASNASSTAPTTRTVGGEATGRSIQCKNTATGLFSTHYLIDILSKSVIRANRGTRRDATKALLKKVVNNLRKRKLNQVRQRYLCPAQDLVNGKNGEIVVYHGSR